MTEIFNRNEDLLGYLDLTSDATNIDMAITNVNLGGVSIGYDNTYKTKLVSEAVDTLDKMARNMRGLLDNYKSLYERIRTEKYNYYTTSKKMYVMGMISLT